MHRQHSQTALQETYRSTTVRSIQSLSLLVSSLISIAAITTSALSLTPPTITQRLIPRSAASFIGAATAAATTFAASTATSQCNMSTKSSDPGPSPPSSSASVPRWYQKKISITAPSRGCHLITTNINNAIKDELATIDIGLVNIFMQHTSASLTVNENADPDVRRDLETALNKIVPASWNRDGTFLHTMEGDDDMPGHVKTSLMGPSLTIPISGGRLALGTWQGIYLNEHRDQGGWGSGHTRNLVITVQGQS